MANMNARRWRRGLLLAVLLHWGILLLFAFDVIPLAYHRDGYRFWFHQGGDGYGYLEQANALLTGDWVANKYPLGFPILMTPVMTLLGRTDFDSLVEPFAMLWSIAMFPVGQWLLARLTHHLTQDASVALLAVYGWTLLPLLIYAPLRLTFNAEIAEVSAVHLTWAQMLSDGPATLFTLLFLYMLVLARERGFPVLWVVGLGFVGGFLMLIRLTGVLSVALAVLLMLWERRWREVLVMGMVTLLVFSPQMIYNTTFFGNPWTTGYSVLDQTPPDGLMSLTYLGNALQTVWERIGVLTIVGVGLAIGMFVYAARQSRYLQKLGTCFVIGLGIELYCFL